MYVIIKTYFGGEIYLIDWLISVKKCQWSRCCNKFDILASTSQSTLSTPELTFVDFIINFDILRLLSEFLFCLKKVLDWQSWWSDSKTLFPALVSTQSFPSLWQILDVAERSLLCLCSSISVLKSEQSIACRLSKL